MLNIISLILEVLDRHVIWLYAACAVLILVFINSYAAARKRKRDTPFTIEREVASHQEGRAMMNVGAMLGVAALITALRFLVVPTLDLASLIEPTPTLTLPAPAETLVVPTPTPTTPPDKGQAEDTPDPEQETTQTPEPTPSAPTPTAEPTDTPPPPPPPANCPNGGVQIASPGSGATVSGQVAIYGTASIDLFQFYKVEFSVGEQPGTWTVINDLHYEPVIGGVLETLNTTALPNGPVWVQLTVVDETGNFPAPCRARLNVSN